MAVYDVWINGESLTTDEYAVDTFEGRRIVPKRSNVNHQFAGMNGVSPSIGSFEEHQFSLEMWVLSAPFGKAPSAEGLEKNLDKILGLFVPNTFMTVSWRDADNGIRSAECLCTAAVTPEIDHLSHFARVKVSFTNPHCFWRGTDKEMTSKIFNLPISITAVNKSTAPIDDAEFYIKGPIENPRIESGPSFVEYVGNLTVDQALLIRNRAISADLITYSMGSDVIGPELLANGGFDDGLTGWATTGTVQQLSSGPTPPCAVIRGAGSLSQSVVLDPGASTTVTVSHQNDPDIGSTVTVTPDVGNPVTAVMFDPVYDWVPTTVNLPAGASSATVTIAGTTGSTRVDNVTARTVTAGVDVEKSRVPVIHKLRYSGSNPRFVDLYPRGNVKVVGSGITDSAYWKLTVSPTYC